MPVTELYAFNLICENLLAALYGVALRSTYNYEDEILSNADLLPCKKKCIHLA